MNDTPQRQAKPQAVLRRITLLCRIIVGLFVAGFVVNLLLNTASQRWPNWLPRQMSGTGFEKDITQRVIAAEKAYTQNPALLNEKLCVFLGLSSQRESVDLAQLTQLDGIQARYLGLCGAGGSIATLQKQSAALLKSNLKPNLVVIGMNLYHQVNPLIIAQRKADQAGNKLPTQASIPIITPLLKGDLRKVYHQTRQRVWVYEHRRDVSTVLTEKLATVNSQILELFGTTSQNGSDQLTSPWREMIRINGPEHASAATFASQIKSYRSRGLFDPNSYNPQTIKDEVNALTNIISQLQARGSKVVIMLMPEYSQLREAVPAIAMQRLKTALGDKAPQIIDMREALPDEMFSDIAHLNAAGREAYSTRVAPMLVEMMK